MYGFFYNIKNDFLENVGTDPLGSSFGVGDCFWFLINCPEWQETHFSNSILFCLTLKSNREFWLLARL